MAPQSAGKVRRWLDELRHNENHLTLILSLLIGALVGLVVVAFILLTGRLAARMYPAGGSGWRRIFVPTIGSLVTGYLLWRFFPNARGSGIPQTKAALFIQDGKITFQHPSQLAWHLDVRAPRFKSVRDWRRSSHEILD